MDSKLKWKQSFQKAKSLSQSSLNASRKGSLLDEETSDQELQDYLESLKRKSGIKRLWSGQSFEKTVRNDGDKTPDISVSSSDMEEGASIDLEVKEDDYSNDDFKPNIVMLPESLSDPKEDPSDLSSGELLHGVQLANFDLSEGEANELPKSVSLNNDDLSKSVALSEPKDINGIFNNLQLDSEIETEDEVAEEIEDDVDDIGKVVIPVTTERGSPKYNSFQSSPEPPQTTRESTPSGRRSMKRPRSRAKSTTSVEQSYTMDFSTADEASVLSEKTEPLTQSSRRSRSSRSSNSSHSSRSSQNSSSRSSTKSRTNHSYKTENSLASYEKPKSSHTCKSRKMKGAKLENPEKNPLGKRKNNISNPSDIQHLWGSNYQSLALTIADRNSHLCDIGVQTGLDLEGLHVPSGLGIGMATSGQSFGMQYVDPTPIATHAVSPDALEAVTAYNPAVVALTDMLKQQIRLVQQFVDTNNRMYQAYTSNLNTQYRYTTLEDTLEKNKPRPMTMKEALKQIKEDES